MDRQIELPRLSLKQFYQMNHIHTRAHTQGFSLMQVVTGAGSLTHHTHIHTHARTHSNTHTHAHTHTHMRTGTHTHRHAHALSLIRLLAKMHLHINYTHRSETTL
jgi:hypothetical protein